MPENNTVVFITPTELVQDMQNYKHIVYASQIPVFQRQPKGFAIAAHTQQNFTDVSLAGSVINFCTKIEGVALNAMRICQPLMECVKTSISDEEARYILKVENCESVISMLALGRKA